MTKVVILGHNSIIVSSIHSFLTLQNDLELLPVTKIGQDLQATFKNLRPDVVVMEIMESDAISIRSICNMAQKIPEIRIILLLAHFNEAFLFEMLRSGIRSCLSLDAEDDELLKAIYEVSQGRRYLSNVVYSRVLESVLTESPGYIDLASVKGSHDDLTDRQREVIGLVAQDYTCREIANLLCVSPRTVETHRFNAMHKLGLRSHIALLRYAISNGIIPNE